MDDWKEEWRKGADKWMKERRKKEKKNGAGHEMKITQGKECVFWHDESPCMTQLLASSLRLGYYYAVCFLNFFCILLLLLLLESIHPSDQGANHSLFFHHLFWRLPAEPRRRKRVVVVVNTYIFSCMYVRYYYECQVMRECLSWRITVHIQIRIYEGINFLFYFI